MKIVLEVALPKELETFLQNVSQAALVYTEGAKSFPPAECIRPDSVSVPCAAQVEEPAQASPPSAPVSQPAKVKVSLAEAKDKILSLEGGHALAMEKLKAKGFKKLADLNSDQLVDFLAELGVAS